MQETVRAAPQRDRPAPTMMSALYQTPSIVLAGLLAAVLFGALEVGRRLGRGAQVTEQECSAIAAPILAVVGLILAFSFSMATDRQAQRRATSVQEANSIGTFWLRTSLAPEPIRSEMRSRVRRYVDLHFEHREAGIDHTRLAALETEAGRLQAELWALFVTDARANPEAARVRLMAPALNAMIDDGATMLASNENRLPDAIFLYLFILVVVAAVVLGYRPEGVRRSGILWAGLIIVLTGVLVLLLDLDRPRRGLIQSDVTPYVRLRESMQPEPP
jgi:hypothetical protein